MAVTGAYSQLFPELVINGGDSQTAKRSPSHMLPDCHCPGKEAEDMA